MNKDKAPGIDGLTVELLNGRYANQTFERNISKMITCQKKISNKNQHSITRKWEYDKDVSYDHTYFT